MLCFRSKKAIANADRLHGYLRRIFDLQVQKIEGLERCGDWANAPFRCKCYQRLPTKRHCAKQRLVPSMVAVNASITPNQSENHFLHVSYSIRYGVIRLDENLGRHMRRSFLMGCKKFFALT